MSKEASAKVQRGQKSRKQKERKTTTTQKEETIKIPFRHKRDSSEQGRWGPWWRAEALHLWRRPQMAVMSIKNGSAGCCNVFHKSLFAADPGQEEQSFSLVIRKVHRVRMIMRCHIRLLWSDDAVRAFLIRSFSKICDYTFVMMVKAHDWQFDWEYQPPTHVMELFTFFSTCDIFPLVEAWCVLLLHISSQVYFSEFDKKRVEKEKRRKAWVMIDATQLNVSVMHNVFPCYISQVKSAQSNKAICNYNNMCWSDMLKVIQHVYIMPSSGWGGLNAWQLWSTLSLLI